MYVTPTTSEKEIRKEIKRIELELAINERLTTIDRTALHEELDYLNSFLPFEPW